MMEVCFALGHPWPICPIISSLLINAWLCIYVLVFKVKEISNISSLKAIAWNNTAALPFTKVNIKFVSKPDKKSLQLCS